MSKNRIFFKTKQYLTIIVGVIVITFTVTGCGLFDKDLKQDEHIASFKRQIYSIRDSINNPKQRLEELKDLITKIEEDDNIYSSRKKNKILMEGYFSISNEYLQLRNYDKAIDICNTALALDTTNSITYYNRGCIYQSMNRDDKAISDYAKAISINPEYADAYYNRAIIYQSQNKYTDALDDYNRILKMKPNYLVDVYNGRGNTYYSLKEFDKAMMDYNTALGIDSTHIQSLYNRAILYKHQNKLDEALADYTKILTLNDKSVEIYYERAGIYLAKGERKKAEKDYTRALELDPSNKYRLNDKIEERLNQLNISHKTKKKE